MNPEETTLARCNSCVRDTHHMLVAIRKWKEVEIEFEGDERPPIYMHYSYEFLQCCGCECVTMRRIATCPDMWNRGAADIEYFPPIVARRRPPWEHDLPVEVLWLLREVYMSLHADCRRLAVMGARTLVDMVILDKIGDIGNFKEKITRLEQAGFIGKHNRQFLEIALDAGNAAAHRGHVYKSDEVNQIIDIVENLLQTVYSLQKSAEQIKKTTPPRKRKNTSI